ncbi:hypothetical protein R3P38DRAFT_3174241 [Favolaschia claudopus]|uniref:Uncharacterized protein n=1 Tax=Favolaschia claudopus TaxID=2862362 RepID=A0AAW0DE47_9AGAR
MDAFYPHHEAADLVQFWSLRASEAKSPLIKAGIVTPAFSIDPELATIKKFEGGDSAKVFLPDANGHAAEVTFSIVGVLGAKDLPPVKKSQINSKRVPYIRQHAGILGYGSLAFEES